MPDQNGQSFPLVRQGQPFANNLFYCQDWRQINEIIIIILIIRKRIKNISLIPEVDFILEQPKIARDITV